MCLPAINWRRVSIIAQSKYINIFGIMHIFLQFLHLEATFFINLLNRWTILVISDFSAIR
jgi:hypothetical protein